MKFPPVVLALALLPGRLLAENPVNNEDEFFSLERATLEQVLNAKTSVSTLSKLPLRETPGLVTVITGGEIRASGARDLIDVLNMVPELEFGADGWGNVGLGVRGNWANEGKVLLLWDGQTYNESLYTSIQFDRFPVDQIEQIEIIKGPGSVIYGGYAELAVINIKTRQPESLDGSEVYAAYGQARAKARSYAGYSFGKVLDGGAKISAKAFWGESQRSDRRYTDGYGESYSMNGASDMHARSLNLYGEKNGASLRLILDRYYSRSGDGYGDVLSSGTERISFNSTLAEIKYDWHLSEKMRLEPRLSLALAEPWHENNQYYVFDKETRRLTAAVHAFYDHSREVTFSGGAEYSNDRVEVGPLSSAGYQYADMRSGAVYDNTALFGQAAGAMGGFNVAGGARYDSNSGGYSAFSPRLSVTRLWDRFSLKGIYSKSFRAPSIENIRLNPEISPERTTTAEFEAGYKAGSLLFVSANVFQSEIKDPILYWSDNVTETYTNYDRACTNGFGLGMKFKSGASSADLNYSYNSAHESRVDNYSVPGHGDYMLGLPKHKLTLAASIPAGAGFSVNPSAIYRGRRYGYAYPGAIKGFNEVLVANLNLQLKDRLLKGLTLNLGVRDMFNSGYSYLQPYAGGHSPLPAPSREVFFKAIYGF